MGVRSLVFPIVVPKATLAHAASVHQHSWNKELVIAGILLEGEGQAFVTWSTRCPAGQDLLPMLQPTSPPDCGRLDKLGLQQVGERGLGWVEAEPARQRTATSVVLLTLDTPPNGLPATADQSSRTHYFRHGDVVRSG